MSESEEMYLISIALLNETGIPSPVPLSKLALTMEVKSVSANEMVHKLEEDGLLTYTPYKGVELTTEGLRIALQVIRKRRLWEVFLVEYLSLSVNQAEEIACQLEHILSNQVSERLAEFLGFPQLSPQNKPIPGLQDPQFGEDILPLCALRIGEQGEITRITAGSAARSFLAKQGFVPQARVTVMAIARDGERLLKNDQGQMVHLNSELSDAIWIKH